MLAHQARGLVQVAESLPLVGEADRQHVAEVVGEFLSDPLLHQQDRALPPRHVEAPARPRRLRTGAPFSIHAVALSACTAGPSPI
jgi:hypothetical protein